MNSKTLLLITIIISAVFTGCYNQTLPDETGRICEPNVMLVDSYGCLPGCDLDASAYFCTADGRGQECRIVAGRVCRTDPGCPGGGAECGAGVGACLRHGETSCPAGSSVASVCSAVAGTPGAEICRDGIDNDCDGTADDGCPTCVATGPEICDNLDNDCVGGIDNGCDDDNDDHCDSGMSMGASGSLACPRTPPGRSTGDDCDDTNPGRCPSAVEICGNGIDEDCNGSDLVCPTMCVAEVCNGRDDDCDGVIDDGVRNACGTCGAVPVEVCTDSVDNDCDGVVNDGCAICTPVTEICNGLDDDCDGFRDEGGVCAVCEDNLGGTLRVRPSASLLATCPRGLVTIAWGPGGTELRSVAGASSYSIVMTSTWRGWVRLQAFCPDDPSRGSEVGNWAGTTTDWTPRIGGTLRSAGYTVDIDGMDLSDAGYVCRESPGSSLSKPHVPLDMCSTFACPR